MTVSTALPRDLDAPANVSAPENRTLEPQVDHDGDSPSTEVVEVNPADRVKFESDVNAFSDLLYGLGDKYRDVFARYEVDGATQSVIVSVSSEAPEERAEAFRAEIVEATPARSSLAGSGSELTQAIRPTP